MTNTMQGDKPHRTRRWQARHREILFQAEELFAQRGYAGTRLEDIGEALGIQRPSLLYYFEDKQTLYDATLGNIVRDLAARVEALDSNCTPSYLQHKLADLWLDFALERPHAARIVLRQLIDDSLPTSESSRVHVSHLFSRLQALASAACTGTFDPTAPRIDQFLLASSALSLLWVGAREAGLRSLDFDTLAPENLAAFKGLLTTMLQESLFP